MDMEKCVEAVKDPQLCSLAGLAGQLSRTLVDCVESESLRVCYYECLKMCRNEAACLGALEVALGVTVARDVVRIATKTICPLDDVDVKRVDVDIVALLFKGLLRKIEKMECPRRAVAARVLAIAALALHKVFKEASEKHAQEILMLMAPALAAAHRCGEQALSMEMIEPLVGEVMKRITTALKEGNIQIGDVGIEFEPIGLKNA
jgi:hypothetical protein